LNAKEDIVAYRPVDRILDVNPANVIPIEGIGRIGLVIRELFGTIIVKEAILNAAFPRPPSAFLLRHGWGLYTPLPDIVDDAVVNRRLFRSSVGIDFEPVPLDVPNSQVRDRNALGARYAYQFAMPTRGTVKNDLAPITGGTSKSYPVSCDFKVAGHQVMPIRQQYRASRNYVLGRLEQFIHRFHLNDVSRRLRERGCLGKPRLVGNPSQSIQPPGKKQEERE
jgi:hypothetical protein